MRPGPTTTSGCLVCDGLAVNTTTALFVVGYPVSIVCIARWLPIVRQQRFGWFAAHQLAVGCIVLGWVLRDATAAVAVNGTWWVVAAIWFAIGRRRRPEAVTTRRS